MILFNKFRLICNTLDYWEHSGFINVAALLINLQIYYFILMDTGEKSNIILNFSSESEQVESDYCLSSLLMNLTSWVCADRQKTHRLSAALHSVCYKVPDAASTVPPSPPTFTQFADLNMQEESGKQPYHKLFWQTLPTVLQIAPTVSFTFDLKRNWKPLNVDRVYLHNFIRVIRGLAVPDCFNWKWL